MLGLRVDIRRPVAEICVIVAGVLIALGADSWWTERQERQEEIEVLAAIKVDLQQTAVTADQNLERVGKRIESLRVLAEGSAGPVAGLSDDALADMLTTGLWDTGALSVQMSAYDEIKTSGRLRLIQDPELRRSLANFDRTLQRVRAREAEAFEHQHSITGPYVVENIQVSQLDEAFQNWPDWVPLKVDKDRDHRLLLDTPEFQNQVAARYLFNFGTISPGYRFRGNIDELEALVDARLAELQ